MTRLLVIVVAAAGLLSSLPAIGDDQLPISATHQGTTDDTAIIYDSGGGSFGDYLLQHQSIQSQDDFFQYVQDVEANLEPIGPELLQVESGCEGEAIDLIPYYGEPDDIWEQRKNPSTGKVFAPEEPIILRFSHPVDGELIEQNYVLRIEGLVPHANTQDYDCTDPPAGAGTLPHRVEYTAKNYMGISDSIIIRHEGDPFKAGCKYNLDFVFTPVNAAGQCIDFHSRHREIWIAGEAGTRFSRETIDVRYDRGKMEIIDGEYYMPVIGFAMKLGVTLTPEEMWLRYKNELGLRDYRDKMEILPGYPKGSLASFGIQYSYYQQHYLGVPVDGGSFLVRTNYDGYLVSVAGSIKHDINIDTEPQISRSEAKAQALFQVAAEVYGWEVDSSIPEPEGRLMIVFPDGGDTPRLVWRFTIDTAIPFDSFVVDVAADNDSNEIVSNYSNSFLQDTTGQAGEVDPDALLKSAKEYGVDVGAEARIMYPDSKRQDLWAGKVTLGDEYYVLSTKRWFPFDTLYDVDNHPTAIFNQDGTFDEVNERAGASVHWAILKMLDYLYAKEIILGPKVSYDANQATDQYSVNAFVTANPKRFKEVADAEATLGAEIPTYASIKKVAGKNEYAFLFSLASQELRAAVAPDVVAHEFCHMLMHLSMGNYSQERPTPSIVEGICDTFAALLEYGIREGQGDWCQGSEIRLDGKCIRNLAAPWDSAESYPSTWDSAGYNAIVDSCEGSDEKRCGHHATSTVISHAFYLMVEGGSGQNENECPYEVKPLSPNNPQESRDKLLKILWKLMQDHLPQTVNLEGLRDVTIRAARELFSVEGNIPEEMKTVSAAWEAVGVTGPDLAILHSPIEPTVDFYPWPAEFLIAADTDTIDKPWQAQVISENEDGTVWQEIILDSWTKAVDPVGRPVLKANVDLDAYRNYYWRFRQSDDPEAEWSSCQPEQWFLTANPHPTPISPWSVARPPSNTTYQAISEETYPWAATSFSWQEIAGATRYALVVTTNPNITCDMMESGDQSDPKHFVATNIQPGQVPYTLPITLLPGTDYYWEVRAYRQSGDREYASECLEGGNQIIAHFKTGGLVAPELLSPADNSMAYYTDMMTFHWSEVPGANYYRIRFDEFPGGFVKEGTTEATPGATTINLNTSDIETIELSNTEAVRTYTWRVQAIGQSGDGTLLEGPDSEEGYIEIRYPAIRAEVPLDSHQFTTDGTHDTITWLSDWPPGYDVSVRKGSSYTAMNQLYSDTIQFSGNKRHVLNIPTEWGKFYTVDYEARPRNANVANIPLAQGGSFFEIPPEPEEAPEEEATSTTTQACDPPPAATVTSLQQYSSVQMTPGTGTQSANGSISFTWNAVSGADKYKVIITDGYNLSLDVDSQDNITGTSSAPFQLNHYYPYYVSVRSINDCGVGGHDGKAVGFWLYP